MSQQLTRPRPLPAGGTRKGPPTRRRRGQAGRREALAGYLFILPLFLGVSLFAFYPLVRNFYLSMTETGVFAGETFVGADQYQRLVSDGEFWRALLNTFGYAAIAMLGIPISLVVAGLLNRSGLRFKSAYRVIFFLPVVTMPVAIGMIWQLLYNGNHGIINQLLGLVGISPVQWLSDSRFSLVAIGLVGVWAGIGHHVVLLLAALQNVPNELLEAAKLDGAGPVRRFRSVSVPMISPAVFLVSVLTVIHSMQTFDLVLIMMGPSNPAIQSAQTIVYYFYDQALIYHDRGYAAAIVTALLLVNLILTAMQFSLQKRWVHDDA
ncbi:carbohydrate ABC transporter permease [Micromonospora coxensis]|uniref:Carbohydrate ABC transporter membrane protein 1, CUT1 family n=1 Tax=Micromonospora coxensis TaxID=356852 RepID=A0A1C5GVD9_9ACTN|nr:sugar ABC transporter permease [Micromonospora coxensis]SCG37762.1 carbohydrate ABC transporter membrane protein 1, CUT1 family [Micromonospora coxensis]